MVYPYKWSPISYRTAKACRPKTDVLPLDHGPCNQLQGLFEMTCAKMAEPIEMLSWVGPRIHILDGVHISDTWQIRLNCPCAAAMRSFCQITSNTCCLFLLTIILCTKSTHLWQRYYTSTTDVSLWVYIIVKTKAVVNLPAAHCSTAILRICKMTKTSLHNGRELVHIGLKLYVVLKFHRARHIWQSRGQRQQSPQNHLS